MPRFFIVVHQDVSMRYCCRHNPPPTETQLAPAPQVETILSSTPSVTRNSTSCGVSPAAVVPLPGAGIVVFMLDIAVLKSVSVSLVPGVPDVQADVKQLLE